MSLQAAAQYLARHGREGDTTLVHMTPDEVRGLQQLAEMHGTTLTINPDTGLPEAFNLKRLLKSVAPIALGYFLGPAGAGLFQTAAGAGLAVGAGTTALTGSLEKGIMAGLGAYGGAGIGAGVEGLGEASLSAGNQSTAETARLLAQAGEVAPEAAQQFATANAPGTFTAQEAMKEGLKQAVSDPSKLYTQMGPEALRYTAAAAAPLAMEMSKTDMPDVPKYSATAAIHPKYAYRDPEGHIQFVDLPGVKMADWDPTKSVSEYARSLIAEPVYEDEVKRAADGGMMSAQDLYYSNEPVVRMADGGSTNPAPGSDKYVENVKNWFASNPQATAADVQSAIQQYGLNPADVQSAMQQAGLSGAAQYAAFHPDIGAAGNVEETYGGLKGLSSNINYWMQQNPQANLNQVQAEMGKWGLTDEDIRRATGKTAAELYTRPITEAVNPVAGVGGNVSAVVNPNGTITQVAMPTTVTTDPVTGKPAPTATMQNIKDLYTKGGGSLGQVLAPTRSYVNTGSSKGAYDFLMGDASAFPTYKPAVKMAANTFKDINNPTPAELAMYKGRSMVWQDGKMVPNPYMSGTKDGKPAAAADTTTGSGASGDFSGAASGGLMAAYAAGGHADLGSYSDGGRLLRGPGDGVSDSIPATIGGKRPARLADGEFVVPARIVSEIGNGSTEAGARKLYAMMERVQQARGKTVGKGRSKVAKNTRADKYLPV